MGEVGWIMVIRKAATNSLLLRENLVSPLPGDRHRLTQPTPADARLTYLLSSQLARGERERERANVINGATPGDLLDGKRTCGYQGANFSNRFKGALRREKMQLTQPL